MCRWSAKRTRRPKPRHRWRKPLGLLLTNVVSSNASLSNEFVWNFSHVQGASVLHSLTERNGSRSHTEHAEAPTANQTAAQPTTPTIRTPRSLEMRLAMNNDILGDEDLMTYAPGPDLTSILGRDLSIYPNHRMSGRDIIMNQVMQRKDLSPSSRHSSQGDSRSDPLNSSCQNNSKMDTPILNRKIQRTWSSSGFARKGEETQSKYCVTIGWIIFLLLPFLQKKKLFRI